MSTQKSSRNSSRDKLLRAAEDLMRESGYAAVTSRQVAKKAGLKPQLVHYHFDSMDDLFLAVYRQFANNMMERQLTILDSDQPLRTMWQVTTDARGVLLTEFLALANHRKVIHKEITEFGNRFRRNQIEIMEHILEKSGVQGSPWTPGFSALLLNSLARGLAVEGTFEITQAHAEALSVVEDFIDRVDRAYRENTIREQAD